MRANKIEQYAVFFNYQGGEKFEYGGDTFFKRDLLGMGGFAGAHRFESLDPKADPKNLVVKCETGIYTAQSGNTAVYANGDNFQSEANFYNQVYQCGVFSGIAQDTGSAHYILMPYFPGKTLKKLLAEKNFLQKTYSFHVSYRYLPQRAHFTKITALCMATLKRITSLLMQKEKQS